MDEDAYEKERVLIEPRRRKGEPPVSPRVILTFTPVELRLALQALDLEGSKGRTLDLSQVYSPGHERKGPDLIGPAMGAPTAVFLLERIIALGGRTILTLGTCGSLQPDLPVGEMVLPVEALSEEGTSVHYGLHGSIARPLPGLYSGLEKFLTEKGLPFRKGRIWTTDAPFRETVEKVSRYRDRGILAVDMETSALMTASAFRGVSLAGLLVVSDELGSLKWRPGFTEASFLSAFQRAARLLMDFLAEETDVL